ncbi:MAG: nucleotidyltransferase family protein [Oscillospiraceae bacterium]|jgi:predicted nucleotidyltransferase|nr:nucleotidyltransferase family protein [Oscillospiraceae bacterium]
MTCCAVIAEYNPMHRGHLYHIAQTKARLGQDAYLAAVMSGHTVQRGDFPILSKTARTRMALEAGFDLVFELPAPYACATAERFARGAAGIIATLGIVTHLSFGSETGDLEALEALSRRPLEEIPKGMPNNVLALEYLRALREKAPSVVPLAVKRIGGPHDGPRGSASAIRKRILAAGRVPWDTPFMDIWREEIRAGRVPVSLVRQERAVLSHLRRMTPLDFWALPDVGAGGLAQRLHHAAGQARSLEELYHLAKTKRYTMARIRRCVLAAFLGLTEEMTKTPPHLRLLGIGKRGGELLSCIEAPIISRPAAHKEALATEAAVTDQFALCMPEPEAVGLEWRSGVVRYR